MKKLYFYAFLFLATHLLQAQPVLVKNISPKSINFTALGNLLFYTSNDSLFKSDGTEAGTVFVKAGINGPASFKVHNGLLYFITSPGFDLWRSDGTAAGTYILASPDPSNKSLQYFAELGNKLLFKKSDVTYGTELFITDGTVSGTTLLKDIYTGVNSSSPKFFGRVGSVLFFSASNLDGSSSLQNELWKTDGTPSGTIMVKDINPSGSSIPSNTSFAVTSSHVYFIASDGIAGPELWKSDGTEAGTMLVIDIVPGTGNSYYQNNGSETIYITTPEGITEAGNSIYFTAGNTYNSTGDHVSLWKSDGTEEGTVIIKDIPVEAIQGTFEFNNKLIIIAIWGIASEIWVSDGTEAGTLLLKGKYRAGDNYYGDFRFLTNNFVFTENIQGYGYQYWKTNGETSGTAFLKQIPSGIGDSEPVGDTLFFTAHGVDTYYESGDGINDFELWQSDLTAGGTKRVKDITGISYAGSNNLTNVNGTLFFTTSNPVSSAGYPPVTTSKKLWKYVKPTSAATANLVLVNAITNSDIRTVASEDTVYINQNVAIRAHAPEGTVRVSFFINNSFIRNETTAPYALNGDNNGDFNQWSLSPGLYKIAAVPFIGPGSGTPGDSIISYIRVIYPNDTTSGIPFILVNAATDTDIRTLADGETITMPVANRITIRGEPAYAESVVFKLNGSVIHTENSAPFSLAGDNGGDYTAWIANTGSYTLIANAYSEHNGTGTLIQSDTIHFVIILTASKMAAYPNPVNDYTVIEAENSIMEEADVQLIDNSGKIYLHKKVLMEAGSNTIPVTMDTLPEGMYYLKISGETEQRVIKIYKH